MADNTVPGTDGATQSDEMRIIIYQCDVWEHAEFIGTSKHLIEEGLIPNNLEWPKGRDRRRWEAGKNAFYLQREKPNGHKGPPRTWIEVDNWLLRIEVKGRNGIETARRVIERKAQALKKEAYKLTTEGQKKREEEWRKYYASLCDRDFQVFKSKLPALNQPKRQRKAKASTVDPGQAETT